MRHGPRTRTGRPGGQQPSERPRRWCAPGVGMVCAVVIRTEPHSASRGSQPMRTPLLAARARKLVGGSSVPQTRGTCCRYTHNRSPVPLVDDRSMNSLPSPAGCRCLCKPRVRRMYLYCTKHVAASVVYMYIYKKYYCATATSRSLRSTSCLPAHARKVRGT